MTNNTPVELPEGFVDFYKNLETWQTEQQLKIQQHLSFEKLDLRARIMGNNKPLIETDNFSIDSELYKNTFLNLLDHLQDARPEITNLIHILAGYTKQLDFAPVINHLLEDDPEYFTGIADSVGLSPQLLIFLFDHSLRPFLRVYAEPYYKEINEDTFQYWNLPTICPICGGKSHFSRLRSSDGRRFMFCDRCFSEWETPYLRCTHCGNTEPGTIRYLAVENDRGYQLYICDKCRGYLKTYDEKQGGCTTDLFIGNIETVYLDILAQEKGYTNHDV